MDSRGPDFPGSLDRARLYPTSGTPNPPLLGPSLADSVAAARHSSLAAGDLAARAGTPGPVDPLVAHYQSRFGLPPPPSLLLHSPPRGYGSLMSSYLTGNSSSGSSASDFSRSLLSGLSPYWTPPHTAPSLSATDSYARYASGLGGGLYPPYMSMLGEAPGSLLLPPPPPHQLPPVPLPSHGASPYHRIHELQKEAYLAGNLGLYSASSALLSPTSPSTSSSVPSLPHESTSLTSSSRYPDDRDRSSPVATASAGSSQNRDSSSTADNSSAGIGSGNTCSAVTNSSRRPDRHSSRESLDDRASGSSVSSQARGHSHSAAASRPEGPAPHPEKASGSSNRDKDAGHRRGSHVSPEPSSSKSTLEIKRESIENDKETKAGAAKASHAVSTDAKIKNEKSDSEASKGRKNKEVCEGSSINVAKDSELESKVGDGEQSESKEKTPAVVEATNQKKSENVKAERVSPVEGADKTTKSKTGAPTKGSSTETSVATDKAAEKLSPINDKRDKKESTVTVDDSGRKSTDSSARSEPIDIKPQRDIKESASPEKAGSEISGSTSTTSASTSATTEGSSPAGQKSSSAGVKQEKSPTGSTGASTAPAKVLTTTSGGVVYAMYPAAGEDGEESKDGEGPYYKMMYSCTPSSQQKRGVSGRKVHATTYMPEVGTIVSTTTTQSSPTSAKTPAKPVKTENPRSAGHTSTNSAPCDVRTSLSPSQMSMTSSNSNSSLSSSGSGGKQDPASAMLSPESGSNITPRTHHLHPRPDKVPGISPDSQTTLRRHILGHKLKDEPGINKDRAGSKDDQAMNLSTSPRAPEYAAKSSDKHSAVVRKCDRLDERRAGAGGGSRRAVPMGPEQPTGLPLPYRDVVHQSQFRDHSAAMPLNLVNTSMSPSLNSTAGTANSGSDNKDTKDSAATNPSRSSSRDSTASLSRPSAPVNPAADTGGALAATGPGMLPPWAGLPYGSMGYLLPWDTMMFREQLRSLPEDERRRLIEMGYIPPHLLLDAGLADPRFPPAAPATWPQAATNSTPMPLVVKDNKTKVKSETSGHHEKSTGVRDRSPLKKDSSAPKPESISSPPAGPSRGPAVRMDMKADEGQRRHDKIHSGESPPNNTTSGGQVIKVDVTSEHKTQVDIKPFGVVPQPPAASNNNRPAPADEPPSMGPNIPVGIAIAQQRADAKRKDKSSTVVAAAAGGPSGGAEETGTPGAETSWSRDRDEQARNRDMMFRQHREVLATHSQRSRTSTATANSDGGDAQSETGKDARSADGSGRVFPALGDTKPSLPVTPPAGFKLMQDPLTGQLFIIPESVMEGVGRILPSQTGAATTRPAMTRPQPPRLEAVVQPQQQALRHKQKVEGKPSDSQSTSERSNEPKVNLPRSVAATATRQTVGRVEMATPPGVGAPSAAVSAQRGPEPSSTATRTSRPQPRLLLGDKAMTVQAQPMPYIPGLTAPENLDQPSNPPLAQFPSHLPYLMDSALLQELQQLRQLHANITSASASTKCESKSVQSRGTSPIVIPDDEGSETPAQSSAKVTTSTCTETEPQQQPQQAPQSERLSRRQSSTTAVQTSPTVESQPRPLVATVEQSVQTCTECSQIHQAAQELLSIGSRRNSGNNALDAADIEVQGICAGHALHELSPKPVVFGATDQTFTPGDRDMYRGTSHSPRGCNSATANSTSSQQQQRDLSYLEPELCQVSDGLELLSVLAEHAQKHTEESEEDEAASVSEDDNHSHKSDKSASPSPVPYPIPERKSSILARVRGLSNEDDDEPLPMNSPSRLEGYELPDINKNYNAPKSLLHDKQGGFSGKLFGFKKETAGLLAETTFKYPDVLDGMDAMELEMRMRLAELQRRYKEKQRELTRLTPKRDRDSKPTTTKKSSSPNRQSSSESESSKKKKKVDAKPELKKSSSQAPVKAKPKTEPAPPVPTKKVATTSTPSKPSAPVPTSGSAKKKLSSSSTSDSKESAVKTPAKSFVKPAAASTPKPVQTPSKTPAKSDSKLPKPEENKTPASATKKAAPKPPAKLVPLPDSDSDDIEGVSWMKDDELKKASFSNLSKDSKTNKSSAAAPKANWESTSSSSEDSELDLEGSSEDSEEDEYPTSSSINTTGELELSVAAVTSAALKSKKRKKHPDEPDVKDPDENPVKKRKPGRPKKCGEEEQAGITETIVAKTTKNFGLMTMKDAANHIKTKAELKSNKPMWDENWGIRRSERIFLNDPGPLSPSEPNKDPLPMTPKLPPSKLPALKDPTPLLKAASTALALKTKASVKDRSKVRPQDMNEKDGKQMISTATDSSSDSSSSESEGDDVPLSSLVERSGTPEPKSCVISKEDLKDNMRVLIFMEGLFYEGEVKEIEPPDIYGVVIDGERGNRPHILTQEELLNEAIFDVKPTSVKFVPEGRRVCAYWSQQYACLYPGTVAAKGADSPEIKPNLINVEFDDGDSAKIPLDHIRMLPVNYPVVSQEPQPLLVLGKRKRRTGSEDVLSLEPVRERKLSFGETSQSGDKKKTPSKPVKTSKSSDGVKQSGAVTEEEKPERSRKESGTDKDSSNRSLSPGKLEKARAKSSGGTQTSFPSNTTDIPASASSSLPQAAAVPPPPPAVPLKTFSSIIKKKHKHKDKVKVKDKNKTKLKRLGGKHTHKHKHHHHKKHKIKDGSMKKSKKSQDGKSVAKKEAGTSQGNASAGVSGSTPAKKEKSTKPESAFSIVPSSGQQSGESGKNGADARKSELTVRIRSNSGDFSHNPFEFRSEDEEESSSIAGTSSSTQSTGQGESAAEAESITTTSHKDDDEAGNNWEDEQKKDKDDTEEQEKAVASPSKKAKTSSTSNNNASATTTPNKRRRARTTSSDSKSKIAAFLPARQLWRWLGKGTKRPGMKGKAKKEFFKAVTRGNEVIRIGDCAVFLSTGRPSLPYVGRIESLWEAWGGNMVVRTRWFYHPEETRGGKKLAEIKGALYQSPHVDENDVQTISHKCYVLSYTEYRSRRAHLNEDNSGIYYLAGTYEPTIGMITFEADVKHH